jgi:ParB family chromosome partitioning protein
MAHDLGVKPGRSKAETVSRITAHVTEGRYSANFGGHGAQRTKTAASDHQRVEAEHAAAVAKREGGAGKAAKASGERTLEQHTHEELKTQARAAGAKVGRTKAETIANIRAKGGNAEAASGHASVVAEHRAAVAKREGEGGQQIQHIPLEHIHVGLNPREHFDPAKIEELAASIKEHGLLQPISVREHQGGYQIIAGERRFRAMQALNSKTVPAIVHNVDDRKARELAIIENVNRADMRPVETAKAYGGLRDDGMSAKEIGKRLGKTEAHVQQHLDLLTLHPHLQKAVDEGRLHFGVVRDLARLTPEHQDAAAEHILSHDLGLKSSKAAIRAYQEREAQVEMFPHGMFPSVHVATQGERDAHAKYQDAIAHITQHLSRLDDETMRGMARVVPSPGRESQRLDLMAKQLRRMQKILDTAEQQRNLLSELTDREYTRLLTLMRRDVIQLRETVRQETVRLKERRG